VVQGVCRQCPPPAPCVAACPEGAIAPEPETGAWMVDEARCTGCGQCVEACPWHVMTFDQERQVASKCFLCHGRPRCVAACPAGALRYVPWTDLTHPVRVPTPSPTPAPTSGPKA
ncbi:MAG: 4Fe-4S dicluster domain-containing protein, partial [Desulfovibrionaceae bacterium]